MEEEKQGQTEGQGTPQQPEAPPPIEVAPRTSGLAIASLVLGILGLFLCVTAPIGLILGIIAITQINRDPERITGRALAIAGVIVSGIIMFFSIFLAAILFPVFQKARERAQQSQCLNNVKQLSVSMQMYLTDWDAYPPVGRWNDAVQPYFRRPEVMVCPRVKPAEPSYAMNERLSGRLSKDVKSPASTISLFESVPGPNRAGGPELLPAPPRHSSGHSVGYVDGHAMTVNTEDVKTHNWNPAASFTQPLPSEGMEGG